MARLTVYADVILPLRLIALAGISGRSARSNQRAQNQGGYAVVNVLWNHSLREYDFGFVPMLPSEWALMEGLFEITDAGAIGFLIEDPKDCSVTSAQAGMQPYAGANVGTLGQGYGVPVYRLAKKYSVVGTTRTYARRITRPNPLTAVYTRNGVTLVVGASPGQIALDAAGEFGTVTFVADATQAISSITVGATTVLNFANGTGMVAAMSVGQRVYVSGVTGTAATVLNGLSHAVTAKGATSLAISTATTGLTATAGTAAKYPQSTDVLSWSGGFYVPVHFASDALDWNLVRGGREDQRLTSGQSIVLAEVRE